MMDLRESACGAALQEVLARVLQAGAVDIVEWSRLSGGAIQQNIRLVLDVREGPHAGRHALVLRTDAPSVVASSRSREQEFALLTAAYRAGVAVPRPIVLHPADEALPAFFLMEFCAGTAAAHVLTREGAVADPAGLLRDAGANLARIHAIPVTRQLAFLGPRPRAPTRDFLHAARAYLDHWHTRFGDAHPVLEWGIHEWLRHGPGDDDVVLAHRDYRTGNLLVVDDRVRATFDWEFAGWGNPLEDLGWICAPCWRFNGRQRVAGGIGAAADLLAGYNEVRGTHWQEHDLLPWEALGQIRWAIIALQQTERHLAGGERSLELALTGRLLPELEHDLLQLLGRWETMGS